MLCNIYYLIYVVDLTSIDISEYQIHVLAAVLKGFFRDLPEPVLTYDLFDDFVRAAGMYQNQY